MLNLEAKSLSVRDIDLQKPCRPAIMTLFTLGPNGCREWPKMFRYKAGVSPSVRERELKWEAFLGARLSIKFWDGVNGNLKLLSFDTHLKYFHYQVTRCQLHTNYVRNKYDNAVPQAALSVGIMTRQRYICYGTVVLCRI